MPLKLASVVGFVFTLFGFGVLAWVVGRYFISGTSVPGFAFLASIIAIFSGAQMFTLGIFGEYLGAHVRPHDGAARVRGRRALRAAPAEPEEARQRVATR